MEKDNKTAIIIGAGPAGLTAALELLRHTKVIPIIFEAGAQVGGISKTVNFKGNRMDIGGHRFFSKSDTVMQWWQEIMPIETSKEEIVAIQYHNSTTSVASGNANPETSDLVMLIRNRLSRIFYLRKFFLYPIKLNLTTLRNLGVKRTFRIGFSYFIARIKPIQNEVSLEDFLINRFGKELYRTFFKDYTEKVWGIPCSQISAEWGAQRIKGLSISKAIAHALRFSIKKENSISQKNVETSLIEKFLYPKFGPGQLWEEVARQVIERGGKIHFHSEVTQISHQNNKIESVTVETHGQKENYTGDYFFSTMPVKQLINGLHPKPTTEIITIANGLMYRDFITVGLLVKNLTTATEIKDNWIYIQENDVKIGRLQIFNNWSPYMVADSKNWWLGLEYFCNEGDDLWQMNDNLLLEFATRELVKIGLINQDDFLDGTVIRMPKTYPAYFGSYYQFEKIRNYTDSISNLFLIGRNGMHKYNNQDHSMLTAIAAVENITNGITTKNNIWEINTEMEYHEEK